MDIKDLNKSQLLLLAILLSFIVSIATGITTVTLMEQAPTSVTVPITRVIKETVEKIVPVEGKSQTIVVKEEDLVVDAISKNQSAVFVVTKDALNEAGEAIEVSAGRGFAVNKEGVVVVDAALVTGSGVYYLENASGKFQTQFVSANSSGFAFLKLAAPVDPAKKASFTVPSSGDLDKMKAGQKIIIFGKSINSFIYEGTKDLELVVGAGSSGAMVLNLEGNALGIALSGANSFSAMEEISLALKGI